MALDNEPKGMLHVHVELRLPPSDTMYRRLNHGVSPTRVHVESVECTQAEGRIIVEKMREANPQNGFHATWTGGQDL